MSAVISRATGFPTGEYARQGLFQPLGIAPGEWAKDAEGVEFGSTGLTLSVRDMAKLGELYLNKGEWQGKQIVHPRWVQASTKSWVDTDDPNLGYGYYWWIDKPTKSFVAIGYGGQMIWVNPAKNLVVAVASIPPASPGSGAGDRQDPACASRGSSYTSASRARARVFHAYGYLRDHRRRRKAVPRPGGRAVARGPGRDRRGQDLQPVRAALRRRQEDGALPERRLRHRARRLARPRREGDDREVPAEVGLPAQDRLPSRADAARDREDRRPRRGGEGRDEGGGEAEGRAQGCAEARPAKAAAEEQPGRACRRGTER